MCRLMPKLTLQANVKLRECPTLLLPPAVMWFLGVSVVKRDSDSYTCCCNYVTLIACYIQRGNMNMKGKSSYLNELACCQRREWKKLQKPNQNRDWTSNRWVNHRQLEDSVSRLCWKCSKHWISWKKGKEGGRRKRERKREKEGRKERKKIS